MLEIMHEITEKIFDIFGWKSPGVLSINNSKIPVWNGAKSLYQRK
jgi:hypothetical protein